MDKKYLWAGVSMLIIVVIVLVYWSGKSGIITKSSADGALTLTIPKDAIS